MLPACSAQASSPYPALPGVPQPLDTARKGWTAEAGRIKTPIGGKDFLQIDEGYCSRVIDKLAIQGLIRRARSTQDGRRCVLTLTPRGRRTFLELNRRSERAIETLVNGLSSGEIGRLVVALQAARTLLERGADHDRDA
jgi:DNA-binding PadR family transcriptional regulator